MKRTTKFTGLLSIATKSIPSIDLPKIIVIEFTSVENVCGIATPEPMPVVVLSSSPGYPRVGELLDRRYGRSRVVASRARLGCVPGRLNSSRDLADSKSRTEILRWRAPGGKFPRGYSVDSAL